MHRRQLPLQTSAQEKRKAIRFFFVFFLHHMPTQAYKLSLSVPIAKTTWTCLKPVEGKTQNKTDLDDQFLCLAKIMHKVSPGVAGMHCCSPIEALYVAGHCRANIYAYMMYVYESINTNSNISWQDEL